MVTKQVYKWDKWLHLLGLACKVHYLRYSREHEDCKDGLEYWAFTRLGQHTDSSVEARPRIVDHEALGQHLGCASRDQLAALEWCKQTGPGGLTSPGKCLECMTRDRPGV